MNNEIETILKQNPMKTTAKVNAQATKEGRGAIITIILFVAALIAAVSVNAMVNGIPNI